VNVNPHRRVQAHEVLRPRFLDSASEAIASQSSSLPFFRLEDCWLRGCYAGSLFAPSDERSFAWRGDFVRDNLPLLPLDRHDNPIEPDSLWNKVAQLNGSSQTAFQRRLGLDAQTLERVMCIAEQQDVLHRLSYWTHAGQTTERLPLVYLSDSGLLHRLLGERSPEIMSDPQRGKSYEGFVIGSLIAAAGVGATARVWGRGQDEIDLILDWPGGAERWAIEITYSQHKRLSPGFHRGYEETEATRAIVIQGRRGEARSRGDIERMRLTDALREIRDC
jgi:hypothetical protein